MVPVLTLLMLAASLAVFARSVYLRLAPLRALRREDRADRVRERLAALARFGLGQRRLLDPEERGAGLLHVLIFAAFLVLALRTLTLFGVALAGPGFHLPLLDPVREWFRDRSILLHDLWHVLTDYGCDDTGEIVNLWFSVGQFGDDLLLSSHPSVTLPTAPILPGTPVALTLQSANAHTAIASATLFYTVDLPVLNAVSAFSERFSRINSTSFVGTIPGLPLGAGVNFTVEAWDFTSTGETSSNFNYSVQPLTTALPSIAQNGSFFYVAVHDAGLNSWVNGAVVTIAGPGGYFRSVGTTFAGLAYPNGTSAPFAPIVVPAGQTYAIRVADPTFRPAGGPAAGPVQVELSATHAMGAHGILAANSTYTVYQNGDLIVFWLNGTLAAPASTPPNTTLVLIGSIAGLVGASLTVFPLLGWWRRIQKRREEETKRITL
jgi:hypothetical protein